MNDIMIIIVVYLLIGLIMYMGQEAWVNENDDDFMDSIDDYDKIKYISISILLWFPFLIMYLYLKIFTNELNNKDELE